MVLAAREVRGQAQQAQRALLEERLAWGQAGRCPFGSLTCREPSAPSTDGTALVEEQQEERQRQQVDSVVSADLCAAAVLQALSVSEQRAPLLWERAEVSEVQ